MVLIQGPIPVNIYARIAQSVEQRTENPRVGGSIPSPGIPVPLRYYIPLSNTCLLLTLSILTVDHRSFLSLNIDRN